MPPFPERESSLLAKLYQTAPWTSKLHQEDAGEGGKAETETQEGAGGPKTTVEAPLANGPLLVNTLPATNPGPLVSTGIGGCIV